MKDENGFTLVELVVIIAIISVILGFATLNFGQLHAKYTVESRIKEIYSTLMRARNDASSTNTPRLVVFSANLVQTGVDADGNNVIDGVPDRTSYPQFTINCGANPCANDIVSFDRRGLPNNLQTIRITGFPGGSPPRLDCITIAATRINFGLMTGANCDHQ